MRRLLVPIAALSTLTLPAAAQDEDHRGALLFGNVDMTAKVSGVLQFRYVVNNRDGVMAPGDDLTNGFYLRRARPKFSAESSDGKIYFESEIEISDGASEMVDTHIDLKPDSRWRVRIGQFTLSFIREDMLSNTKQLAMDRGSTSENVVRARGERVRGIEVRYQTDVDRTFGTVHSGLLSFNEQFDSRNLGAGVTFRYERLVAGEGLKRFDQITAPPGTPLGVLVGGAVLYEQADRGGDHFGWTADISVQNDGVSFMLTGIGSVAEDLNLRGRPEQIWGLSAQAGVYISEYVEPYVRYEWGTTSDQGDPDFSFLTVGANWYIFGQALKFSADVGYAFNPVSRNWDRSSNGLLADAPGRDGQIVGRTQIQLLF